MKVDDYIEYSIPVDRGFVHRVQARVIDLYHDDWGMCRPFSVYAYHPEGPDEGRYLPPAPMLAFVQNEARVIRKDELTASDRPGQSGL